MKLTKLVPATIFIFACSLAVVADTKPNNLNAKPDPKTQMTSIDSLKARISVLEQSTAALQKRVAELENKTTLKVIPTNQ